MIYDIDYVKMNKIEIQALESVIAHNRMRKFYKEFFY